MSDQDEYALPIIELCLGGGWHAGVGIGPGGETWPWLLHPDPSPGDTRTPWPDHELDEPLTSEWQHRIRIRAAPMWRTHPDRSAVPVPRRTVCRSVWPSPRSSLDMTRRPARPTRRKPTMHTDPTPTCSDRKLCATGERADRGPAPSPAPSSGPREPASRVAYGSGGSPRTPPDSGDSHVSGTTRHQPTRTGDQTMTTTPQADLEQHFFGDMRRAAALLAHHAGNDHDGVDAVLDEAEAAGRLRSMAYVLPSVFGAVQPSWHSDATATVMRNLTESFSVREHQGDADV